MIRKSKKWLREVMHPVTLGFRDRQTEHAYREDSLPRFRLQVRIALVLGISLYFLVGILDAHFIPDAKQASAWWIRIATMAYPMLVLAVTFHPLFQKLGQLPVALIGFAPALGGIAVMSLMPTEGIAQYYVGLVIVMFWIYLFLGIRFVYALAVNIASVAAFYTVFGIVRSIPAPLVGSSIFFLLSTNIIGAGAAYLLEYQQRLLFLRNRVIDEERERHKFRSLHDSLTGLPNRDLLEDRLQQAIAASRRDGRRCAGLYLDLDGFKPINDAHGHDAGDEVLRQLAERLNGLLRETDTLARLGGDEFFVLARGVDTAEGAELMAKRVLSGVAEPIVLGNSGAVHIGVSIGICLFPYADCTAHDIIHRGDHAMYAVKRSGKHGYAFSAPNEEAPAPDK